MLVACCNAFISHL